MEKCVWRNDFYMKRMIFILIALLLALAVGAALAEEPAEASPKESAEVWPEESAEHAGELIKRACLAQGRLTTTPLVLHSDNGSPMKGATMLETLYALGITPSNSRPRVSNDNPYSESLFKTLKYRPNYQPKGFASIEEAREWCQLFVNWYRYKHHHSGIKFLTPASRHEGKDYEILEKRHAVYESAKAEHPERWNGRATRDWSNITVVYLNPDRDYKVFESAVDSRSEALAS